MANKKRNVSKDNNAKVEQVTHGQIRKRKGIDHSTNVSCRND